MPKPEKKTEVIIDDCWRKLALAYIDNECAERDLQMDAEGKAEIISLLEESGVKTAALGAIKASIAVGFTVSAETEEDDAEEDEEDEEDVEDEEDDSDDGEPVDEAPRRRARG